MRAVRPNLSRSRTIPNPMAIPCTHRRNTLKHIMSYSSITFSDHSYCFQARYTINANHLSTPAIGSLKWHSKRSSAGFAELMLYTTWFKTYCRQMSSAAERIRSSHMVKKLKCHFTGAFLLYPAIAAVIFRPEDILERLPPVSLKCVNV